MNSKKDHNALSPELIEKYLKGELSHAKMHEVEKLMLGSEFEAEAMEGLESINAKYIPHDLDQLRQRIDQRTGSGQKELTFWIKIAASIAIMAISTFVILNIDLKNDRQEITHLSEKTPAPVNDSSAMESAAAEERSSDSLLAMHEEPTEEEEQPEAVKEPSLQTKETPATNLAKPESKIKSDQYQTLAYGEADSKKIKPIAIAEEANAISLENLMEKDEEVTKKTMASFDEAPALQQKTNNVEIAKKAADRHIREMNLHTRAKAAAVMPEQEKNNRTLTGTVTSAEDGSVLPGVNITVKGSSIATITDLDGQYELTIPDSVNAALVASFIGMKNKEIEAGNKTTIDVQLENDMIALSEIVVIGYGAEKEITTDVYVRSSPAGGWSNFKKYIKNHRRYPSDTTQVRGRVVVDFEITPNGEPVNFDIIRSLGPFYDQEAIRIIKEGPEWTPATRNGMPEQDKVRVRIRFDQ
ncbi:MAG: TonB family protein [Fulvivirga sp.]